MNDEPDSYDDLLNAFADPLNDLLFAAVNENRSDAVAGLVQAGVVPSSAALRLAAIQNKTAIAGLLAHASTNQTHKNLPLLQAATLGHTFTAAALMSGGARDPDGAALQSAETNRHHETAAALRTALQPAEPPTGTRSPRSREL